MILSPYEQHDFDEVLSLLQSAFDDDRQSYNFEVLGRLSDSSLYKRFVVRENNTVIAYLAYSTRSIRYLGINFDSASIGPVAVKHDAQSKGVGRYLMTSIIEHLSASNVELIYIQGIPHYYQKFGFRKYIEKIKRIVPTADTPSFSGNASIDDSCNDPTVYKTLFDGYTSTINFAANRGDEEWRWLLNHACDTYYFYQPKVIRNQDGLPLGYFCEDPHIPDSPREIVFKNDETSIDICLAAIKNYHADKGCRTFDLKIPENSLIAHIIDSQPCDRVVHENPHGGDLLLICDEAGTATKLVPAFNQLLGKIESQCDAKIEFESFAMHFGVKEKQPFVTLDKTPNTSPIEFLDFVTGRLHTDDNPYIQITPRQPYEILQEKLFGGLTKFVFQGDNM